MSLRTPRLARLVAALVLLGGAGAARAQAPRPVMPLPNQRPLTTLQSLGAMQVPWQVSINPSANFVRIGSCQAVYIDIKDESGKETPRQPSGLRVSIADFDWTATGVQPAAAVGVYHGASSWQVCACQAAVEGTTINVTATYPARGLAEKSKVAGLAFRSYIELPVAPKQGTFDPPGCDDALKTTTVAISVPGTEQGASGVTQSNPATSSGYVPPAATGAAPSGTNSPQSASGQVAVATSPSQMMPVGSAPAMSMQAPPGLAVSGTPSHAHVTWGVARGATSYSVQRRSQLSACCNTSVANLAATSWDDANFPIAGTYVYDVTANYANGQTRTASVDFTRPDPVDPTGFVARQTGEGSVTLSWQAVPGVSYYQLWGAGLANTGISVTGTSQQVTGVPAGAQEWMIGSFYTPGPVSTSASSMPRTSLNVTSSVAVTPPSTPPAAQPAPTVAPGASPPAGAPAPVAAPAPMSGHYRIVANGFRVLHESQDDVLSRDGHGDEVYGAFGVFQYNRQTSHLVRQETRRTKNIGEPGNADPGRIRGGTYVANGGFRAGDVFPAVADPSKRYATPPSANSFPYLIWEGTLTDAEEAIIVLPTLWEWDGHADGYNRWRSMEIEAAPRIWADHGVQTAVGGSRLALITPPGTMQTSESNHIGAEATFQLVFLGTWAVGLMSGSYDRPLGADITGMAQTSSAFSAPVLQRRAIVITREIIEAALADLSTWSAAPKPPVVISGIRGVAPVIIPALPPGTLAVPLFEQPAADLQAMYLLYIQVERVP